MSRVAPAFRWLRLLVCLPASGLRWRGLGFAAAICLAPIPVLVAGEVVKKAFSLPADRAENTLRLFSTQSSLEVLFSTEAVENVRTNPVAGEFAPMEAIERLLAGTGLHAIRDEKNGVLRVGMMKNGAGATPPPSSGGSRNPKKKQHAMKTVLQPTKP